MRIKRYIVLLSCCSVFLLNGCMSNVIEEEIQEKNEKNQQLSETNSKNEDEITIDNVELSEEQEEILDNLDQKNIEEILFENELEIREELKIQVPDKKAVYTNAEEFSQYISYIFFAFYSGLMDAETFVNELLPHAHPYFIEQLPATKENQIKTFEVLQQRYSDQLESPITQYVITDLSYHERVNEATFYRKFILKNGKEIYSETILEKIGDQWTLLDDSPTVPYLIPNAQQSFNNNDDKEREEQ